MDRRALNRLPVLGLVCGIALLGLATAWYPGGYRWHEHTISALFQNATPGGAANPARPLAIAGVLATMTGIALLFHLVSRQAARGFHRRAIQGAGIAATVFATLTVALLHDVMVILALVCFMGAIFAVLHMLWDDHHVGLFAMGVLFLALELSTAVMYFGRVGLEFLPIAQKAALALIGIWLLVVQHRPGGQAVHLARPT